MIRGISASAIQHDAWNGMAEQVDIARRAQPHERPDCDAADGSAREPRRAQSELVYLGCASHSQYRNDQGPHDADNNHASPEDERLRGHRGEPYVHHVGKHADDGDNGSSQRSDCALAAKLRAIALDGTQDAEQERSACKRRAEVGEWQSIGVPCRLRLDDVAMTAEEAQHKTEHDACYRKNLRRRSRA